MARRRSATPSIAIASSRMRHSERVGMATHVPPALQVPWNGGAVQPVPAGSSVQVGR